LDSPLIVSLRAPIVYPGELSGSGFIGHIGGLLFVNADGKVDHAVVSYGNEELFQEPSQTALAQWRFSTPKRKGLPVKTVLTFRCDISELSANPPDVDFK